MGESPENLLPADPVLGEADRIRRAAVGLIWRELAEGAVGPGRASKGDRQGSGQALVYPAAISFTGSTILSASHCTDSNGGIGAMTKCVAPTPIN